MGRIVNVPDFFSCLDVISPGSFRAIADCLHFVADFHENRSAVAFAHVATVGGNAVCFVVVVGRAVLSPERLTGTFVQGGEILLVGSLHR